MGELEKTLAGRARIEAATERLDRTVAEMEATHRTDVPQGEKELVQHQTPPAFETAFEFVLIELEHRRHDDHVSREVPPSCW